MDLYNDLVVDHNSHRVNELELEVAALREEVAKKNKLIISLQSSIRNLESNISCLYLTASQELKRKDGQIATLRK
jgi:predicted  nucleic acid-binding Zn-ribbon protein